MESSGITMMWNAPIRTFVVCSAWLLPLGCQDGTAVQSRPVEPAVVSAGTPARRVAATGRVEGWREADVTAKLRGRILRFEYDEGDRVEAGAVVVRLEDLDLRSRVRGAEARATEAARILERTRALRAGGIASASMKRG
jgi:multidrug efflux pump subunit AcrA (membrane-fusion protein)